MASFFAEGCFSPCWDSFTVDNDTFLPASAASSQRVYFCSGVSHFTPKTLHLWEPSPSWAVWWLDVPVVFLQTYTCLNRMWYLHTSGHLTQRWTRLEEVHSPPDILADFYLSSHDVTEGSSVFEICIKMHPQTCLQLTQMLSLNQSDASKAMTSSSGLFQLV